MEDLYLNLELDIGTPGENIEIPPEATIPAETTEVTYNKDTTGPQGTEKPEEN